MDSDIIQFAAEGAPPLVPDLPRFLPNAEQERFIWLHERHLVVKWQWLWQGTQLRAFTERGLTATISKDNVNELVAEGFMRWGLGQSIYLTDRERV